MKLINFKNLLLLPALALPIFLFSQESDQEEVNPYEVLLCLLYTSDAADD